MKVCAGVMRLAVWLICAAGFAPAAPATAQPGGMPPGVTTDPDGVRLEVGELRRLADVLRTLGDVADTTAHIQRHYLANASPGLRAYMERYGVTAASIAAAMARNQAAYSDLDGLADRILAQQDEFRAAFRRLKALFPDVAFPTVWFIAGHHGPGGMVRPEGAVIAAERFAGQVEQVVPLALHEVAHFQQAMVQGVETYMRIYEPGGTLLDLALREGSAELIARLTTGRHINESAERYGLPREAELWDRFRRDMHGSETGDWMFVRPQDAAWPPDLGYWIGYRIVRHYYEQAADKRQAIREILALTDAGAFLAASGYGPSRGK
jgi:hypothetical protein